MAAPTKPSPTLTAFRCLPATGAAATSARSAPRSAVGTNGAGRGLGDHRRGLGRVRQRAVGRHLGSDQDRRQQVHRQLRLRDRRAFGKNTSLGFNRFQGSFGGPITRNLTFFLSGALEGNKSVGTGVDAQKSPIFVQAGIDTVVAVPSTLGDPTSDTTMVPVYNYAAYRGDCDDFSGSADPGDRQQLWRRLPGRPHPVLGPVHLPAEREAQLHLRHRLPDLLYRPGQPVPGPHVHPEPGPHGPGPDLPEPLQSRRRWWRSSSRAGCSRSTGPRT